MAANAEITDIRVEDLEKFKVADLKRELKIRGLSISGNKSELLDRLQVHLQAEPGDEEVVLNEDEALREDDVLADDSKVDLPLEATTPKDSVVVVPTSTNGTPAVPTEILNQNKPTNIRPVITATKTTVPEKVTSPKILSSSEALQLRAKRFNLPPTETARKLVRAERFASSLGTSPSVNSSKPAGPQTEKLEQRATRFGLNAKKDAEEERIKKRKERFGAVVGTVGDQDLSVKKQKRVERFGSL